MLLVQTLFIAGLALVLVRWTLTGPLTRTAKWLRTLRTGQVTSRRNAPTLPQGEIFDQIHREVTHLARDLNAARATAEEEARLRESNVSLWTAERLRVSLSNKLQNKPLFVVSNREPYMHVYNNGNNGSMQVIVPASGLVTALEPVLLASNGTWVANGSGSADREMVDARDRLRVPPDHPELHASPRLAQRRRRKRLLRRLRQRRALAALPHRAHPPDFPPRGLDLLSGGQPAFRRRAAWKKWKAWNRPSFSPRTIISLCCLA